LERGVLEDLLRSLKRGELTVEECLERLRVFPMEDMGFACIDHHRHLRRGLSEVIFGQNKETSQIISIMTSMAAKGENILVTRISSEKAQSVTDVFPSAQYYPGAKTLTLTVSPIVNKGRGTILVICAGTSDVPVAEEAAITARFMGNDVESIYDIGVAGLHRLFAHRDRILKASVIVVAAGMEGALPSVVGGLVDKPVIAVPTSVGYGASFGGIAALLGMLNSCASGVTVVNIDNGFGAGYAASLINRA